MNGQVKLVIWDLDDTFWRGTLSEGGGVAIESNISRLRSLVDRGIMNSISSKNDFDAAKNRLVEMGVWDLFVFPHINWDDKGRQVKDIVESCRLRACNVLFLDDNARNLAEAKRECPDLNVAAPSAIAGMLDRPEFAGNPDPRHERLAQFRVLEKKHKARQASGSNEDFLYGSHISAEIRQDCRNHSERILDLINRSNQLNFTKVRLTAEQFDSLLADRTCRNAYVLARDDFGDYGIVGFISVKDGRCLHFLFSCRAIGLGIEQWAYAESGYPQLDVVGDVVSHVDGGPRPAWINATTTEHVRNAVRPSSASVLVRGGCDLHQMFQYLRFRKLDAEFNLLGFHRDHTAYAVDAINPSSCLEDIRRNVPFVKDNFFDTGIFSGEHDVVVMSVLVDYVQAVFRSRSNPDVRIAYGDFRRPLSRGFTGKYTEGSLDWFFRNFEYTGLIGADELIGDLEMIRRRIPGHVRLVLINGCEVEHENPDEHGAVEVHRRLNRAIDAFVSSHANVQLLDMRKIVTRRDQLTNNIRHYSREVYFRMAEELHSLIGGHEDVRSVRSAIRSRAKMAAAFCLGVFKRRFLVPLKALLLCIAVKTLRKLMRRKIWLFSDRMSRADDNGRVMFDYVRSLPRKKDSPRCIFAIDARSPDYDEIRRSGGEVVDAASWRYKFTFLLSEFVISAYHTPAMRMPFHGDFIACARNLVNAPKFVYLRHGIGIHDISHICNRRNDNATMMVTTVEGEYRSVIDGDTGYTGKEVKLTGLPRYDLLYDDRKKIVTFMPTWRHDLIEWSGDGRHRLAAGAEKSRFVTEWRRILSDERLVAACERLGYTLQLMPHPNLAPVVPLLNHDKHIRVLPSSTPYRKVFAETDLLITDYSSAAFDFAYLRKPLVYFQFDKAEYFSGLYKPGFFDYDKDGLGKVETTVEGLVDEIVRSVEAGCPLGPEYRCRMDSFFAFSDRENRRRVYEAIISAADKQ